MGELLAGVGCAIMLFFFALACIALVSDWFIGKMTDKRVKLIAGGGFSGLAVMIAGVLIEIVGGLL